VSAEAIRALSRALPAIVQNPEELEVRADALYGAWLAGIALGAVSMALHHRLCHVLGGSFNLAHADVHTVMVPQVAGFNREAAPQAMRTIAKALGADDAARGLYDLARAIAAPTSLEEIGMPHDGLDRVATAIAENPPANPRPIDVDGIRTLLERAYRGTRP
jgi:alcohol dehydrogenase class IV